MNEVTCDCGAVYREKKIEMIVRDVDRFDCEHCGSEINSWNGAVAFSYVLILIPKVSEAP